MSAFREMRTVIRNESALVKALKNNLRVNTVETYMRGHEQQVFDEIGVRMPNKANVIVRRAEIGKGSSDVGFRIEANGTYAAVMSGYGSYRFDQKWLDSLTERYQEELATQELVDNMGCEFEERSVLPNGDIQLAYLAPA